MASDDKKKKIESLRQSLQKLSDQKILSKGNKVKLDCIERLEKRFEEEIKKLKAS